MARPRRPPAALVGVTLALGTDSDDFAIAAAKLEPVTEVLHLAGAPDYSCASRATTRRSSTRFCGP
ncbi:MAG TPA: hypothetical protein VHF45_13150 [Thermoleophilaceae bacterium]|nr:hypothetical protein [Thermoleophilaceae bacterium]